MRWIDLQPLPHDPLPTLDASHLLKRIMASRGIRDEAAARAFLDPYGSPSTPYPGVGRLSQRLLEAVSENEPICVWGDFDADGQTSTSALVQTLRLLGGRVTFHVPIRHTEGHGLHIAGLRRIFEEGIRLILTCDTGTTANEAVTWANSHGMQVVITDHHDMDATIPEAYGIINPKALPAGHPLGDLSGVGVAFKLAEDLFARRSLDPAPLLDLVALGMIADVALLRLETRALAARGIRQLRKTERIGLRALADKSQVDLGTATEETIGYALAPRLNAVGRLGDASHAVELLLTDDPKRAEDLAAQIEGLNSQRRLLSQQVRQAAEDRLARDPAKLGEPLLLLEHADWPGGVLGIVASQLVEEYGKPAILLSMTDGIVWRGSARSIDGLNITKAISENRNMLLSFGGHPMAAGLSLQPESMAGFRRAIQRSVEQQLAAARIEEAAIHISEWIPFANASLGLAEELERLAPFGAGNPAPILATRGVEIVSSANLGRTGEHRRLTLVDPAGSRAQVLWWDSRDVELPIGKMDIAYSLRPTAFRGERAAILTLVDSRPSAEGAIAVSPSHIHLVDLRARAQVELPEGAVVWAEGDEVQGGLDRRELRPAERLVLWTAPPSRSELRDGLAVVAPREILVLARPPKTPTETSAFLRHLVGIVKFALRRLGGRAQVSQLAAACGQRELTIRLGLEWLDGSGDVSIKVEGDDVAIETATSQADAAVRRELYAGVRSSLNEAVAYRSYLASATWDLLVKHVSETESSRP